MSGIRDVLFPGKAKFETGLVPIGMKPGGRPPSNCAVATTIGGAPEDGTNPGGNGLPLRDPAGLTFGPGTNPSGRGEALRGSSKEFALIGRGALCIFARTWPGITGPPGGISLVSPMT